MKKFIIILLLLSNFSFAQIYYSHYLDATSEWRILHRDTNGVPPYQNLRYETVFFNGAEDIGGFTYYKMFRTYFNIGYEYDFSAIIYPQSSNITQFMGYFREDPDGKFYTKNSIGSEVLYFDNQVLLNAQVGGVYFMHPDGLTSPTCTTQNAGTLTIDGLNLKTLFSGNDFLSGGSAVEGVGMVFNDCYAPNFIDANYGGMFPRIHCYTKQGQTYSFYGTYNLPSNIGQISCDTFPLADRTGLGINVFGTNEISMYPNPTSTTVSISSKDALDAITVYDIQGRKMQTNSVAGTETTIDISHLQNGTYLVEVITINGKSVSKLIKN